MERDGRVIIIMKRYIYNDRHQYKTDTFLMEIHKYRQTIIDGKTTADGEI